MIDLILTFARFSTI